MTVTLDQLQAMAMAQAPALFHARNTEPALDQARKNVLQQIRAGLIAAGLEVETVEAENE